MSPVIRLHEVEVERVSRALRMARWHLNQAAAHLARFAERWGRP